MEMCQLIEAEQARARRLHPDDHAGHPDLDAFANLRILSAEVQEVLAEVTAGRSGLNLAWELVQVAGVTSAWAQRVLDDAGISRDDLMQVIEGDQDLRVRAERKRWSAWAQCLAPLVEGASCSRMLRFDAADLRATVTCEWCRTDWTTAQLMHGAADSDACIKPDDLPQTIEDESDHMTPEPTEIGTVVRDLGGYLWVRCASGRAGDVVWSAPGSGLYLWAEIPGPTVVHEGYIQPTAEPMSHGARVIDADGRRGIRVPGGYPWALEGTGLLRWSDLTQPVTVVSDGSDW